MNFGEQAVFNHEIHTKAGFLENPTMAVQGGEMRNVSDAPAVAKLLESDETQGGGSVSYFQRF